jgi:hypothetical protein
VPLYCFYNFKHAANDFSKGANACTHIYKGPSFWGCTLARPEDVAAAQSNALSELRPYMRPWHELACDPHADLTEAGLGFLKKLDALSAPAAADGGVMYRMTPEQFAAISKKQTAIERVRRSVPKYIRELIELSGAPTSDRGFLDKYYWSENRGAPDDVLGIAVFEDRRG